MGKKLIDRHKPERLERTLAGMLIPDITEQTKNHISSIDNPQIVTSRPRKR